MADSANQSDAGGTPKLSAPKDKNCPYCGQAFTSSSLGRHLDLYIKEKNPKPADGIHDVDAIRKLRGGITRRQARSSLGGRRDASTPSGTPRASSGKRDASVSDTEGFRSPALSKDGNFGNDATPKNFPPTWEVTSAMNDLPKADGPTEVPKRPGMQRAVSKQALNKAQFDVKQKLSDAADTARAAELALRELIGSWRAARLQIEQNTMPFDFDPLSLDFPALTLQCLQPPPTLFSSTQHPTSTSWAVQSPGQREFDALQSYFQAEFRTWKLACAAKTTAAIEELSFPANTGPFGDVREAVQKAEQSAENLEAQVTEHLQSAYTVWESLPVQRKQELWILELARSVGRRHKETHELKEGQHRLKQENANLKAQLDQLNRLQQPREFKTALPLTVPMERELLTALYEQGFNGKSVGFSLEDGRGDLSTVVSRSIERWKTVIASSRVNNKGMNAQRTLDNKPASAPAATPATNGAQQTPQNKLSQQRMAQLKNQQSQQQQQQQKQQPAQTQQSQPQPPPLKRQSTASTNGVSSEHTAESTTTGPPSIEETSDQDADAEMEDDDSFAIMNASPVKPPPPMQQQATLEVPRTRGPIQQRTTPDPRFMMPNGSGSPVGRAAINMSRSMPNMNMAMQNGTMHGADMSMAMQGVRGDPMYME